MKSKAFNAMLGISILILSSCGGRASNSATSQVSQIKKFSEAATIDGDAKGTAYTGRYTLTFSNPRSSNPNLTRSMAGRTDKDVLECEQTDGTLECKSNSTSGVMIGSVNANGQFTLSNQGKSQGLGYVPTGTNTDIDTLTEVLRGTFASENAASGNYYFAVRVIASGKERNGYLATSMSMKRITDGALTK